MGKKKAKKTRSRRAARPAAPRVPRKEPYSTERFGAVTERVKDQATRLAALAKSVQEAALLAVSLPNPIERQAGYPGWQTRRLANNLLIRMRSVRAPSRCVRVSRSPRQARR